MKKLTILSLLVAAVSFTACKQNTEAPQPQSAANFLTAKKGTTEWVSKLQEANIYKDSTYFFGRVGEENLVFRIKFNGIGKYPLSVSQSRYTITVGGDVVVAEYYVDPTATSLLNIIGYDADKKTYTGNFDVKLKLDYRYQAGSNAIPETLTFTNGSFRISSAK